MTSKLTLTIEKPIIEKAKYYAKNSGRSLSQLVENYLNSLVTENENQKISVSLLELKGKVLALVGKKGIRLKKTSPWLYLLAGTPSSTTPINFK